ncbi:MAG TPA: dihydroorotase [Lachnospiraceae bacterium]|jgi:dihydroorotase, multifunctional complex type|nr:dihydroorotase [Butyrivibrio sp. CAG:318]HJI30958.1 dihydroorotase [Lachnospiraceae bacterium]
MGTLIRNGRVIDPASGKDGIYDILVEDGMIAGVDASIPKGDNDIIDAAGCFVMPGLVDLHVHFREPGFEYKETIKTGSMAAAHGGVTTVFPMPNTKPVIDSVDMYDKVQTIIDRDAVVNVHQVASVTLRQQGETPVDVAALKKAGCIAISEDGKSVMNSQVYREAMKAAAAEDMLVMAHCEDKNLVNGGALNEGVASRRYHVNGITNAVEDVIVARDILLSKETGCRLHLCHCSTADSVKLIKAAKDEGLKVTGEVCPHHFMLCDEDIIEDNADYKMNPPLRSRADMEAVREGLRNGTMDVISTDHAPHSAEEKAKPIGAAPFGITGIETSLCLTYTGLVLTGILTPMQMVEKMSYNPAKIAGIDRGTLLPGRPADIIIVNVDDEIVIDRNNFISKGHNTPFDGYKVKGIVEYTIVGGKIVYKRS